MTDEDLDKEKMDRLVDHSQLCNEIDCSVCKLYYEGIDNLTKAWNLMKETKLVIKIMRLDDG